MRADSLRDEMASNAEAEAQLAAKTTTITALSRDIKIRVSMICISTTLSPLTDRVLLQGPNPGGDASKDRVLVWKTGSEQA